MLQQENLNILPKLRFPEHVSAWKEKKLAEIAEIAMCKRVLAKETNSKAGVPFYKIATLGSTPTRFISEKLFQKYKNQYRFPKKGAVLLSCSGTVGKCVIYDGRDSYYQDSNIVWLENEESEIKNEFLFLVLTHFDWNSYKSNAIRRLYRSDLEKLPIRFPKNKDEQCKIVSCFNSLDKLIKTSQKQLQALEQHKKGLIEFLLPLQHISDGKLSSIESTQKGKLYHIGNLFDIQSGYPFLSHQFLTSSKNNIQLVRISDINSQNKKDKVYLPYVDLNDVKLRKYLVKKGDLLLGLSGSAGFRFFIWDGAEALLNQRVTRIRAKQEQHQPLLFLLEALLSTTLNKKGSGQHNNLSQTALKKFSFFVPQGHDLYKISACITSLNHLIERKKEQLCSLAKHKRGLLEQILPCINAT